ncbi:hypothetical protein [Leptospira licerasiae]|nr:hypothetical protein [Leptospira licerasiae]
MKIDINNVAPFFQVVVFITNAKKPFPIILSKFDLHISETIKKNGHIIVHKEIDSISENLLVRTYAHKWPPTWMITTPPLSGGETAREHENKLNEIFILYRKNDYIFFHTSSSFIESHLRDTIEKGIVDTRLLDLVKIYSFANNDFLEFRTLGINNIFNAGGTAPEAKTLYGRNAEYSLTSSFDAGFGFSYGLGARREKGKKEIIPFGLSAKKRKLWGTWTKNIDDFCNICDRLSIELKKATKSNKLQILATPLEISKTEQLKLLHCYIDYSIPKKGLLQVKLNSGEYIFNWHSHLSEGSKPKMIISTDDRKENCEIELSRLKNGKWEFNYANSSDKLLFLISEEGADIEKRRGTDAVQYLNKQEDFTLLFANGVAYRDGIYWKDNRFSNIFKKSEISITWSNVDITKEIREPENSHNISITKQVKKYLESLKGNEKPFFLIEDNGANEVGDIVAFTDEKFILTHIKFSTAAIPGLRIEDLHVVCAQALKNLRFFNPTFLLARIERLKKNVFYPQRSLENIEQQLINKINNIQAQKECWIVQPGISKKLLEKDKKNKAHSLLNYVDGICNSNNITFRFFCSP